jgi:hypothetical protein
MALVIPIDHAQVAFQFSLVGDPQVMVSTIGALWNFGAATPQEAADNYADAFAATFTAANIATGYTFKGVRMYVGSGGPGTIIVEAPRSVVGTGAATALPSNCAVLVKKGSATPGRSGRGRMFLPPFGIAEADVNANGEFTPAVLPFVQTKIDNALAGDQWRILHDSTTPGAPAPTPITSLIVDGRIATQRRRMR